jgi:hypothetical protein
MIEESDGTSSGGDMSMMGQMMLILLVLEI